MIEVPLVVICLTILGTAEVENLSLFGTSVGSYQRSMDREYPGVQISEKQPSIFHKFILAGKATGPALLSKQIEYYAMSPDPVYLPDRKLYLSFGFFLSTWTISVSPMHDDIQRNGAFPAVGVIVIATFC